MPIQSLATPYVDFDLDADFDLDFINARVRDGTKLNVGKILIPRFMVALHDSPKHSPKRSIDYFGLAIRLRMTRS